MADLLVVGLDIATVTGFAYGRVHDSKPTWGTKRFGSANSTSAEVFGAAMAWARAFFAQIKPDVVMIEGLLPPEAIKNHSTRAVRDRLCGLNAIIIACAHEHNLGEIASAPINDVREHFIANRKLKRCIAKVETIRKCKSLGWDVPNDNVADACACWSYACSMIDPKLALRGSPLFSRIASVWP